MIPSLHERKTQSPTNNPKSVARSGAFPPKVESCHTTCVTGLAVKDTGTASSATTGPEVPTSHQMYVCTKRLHLTLRFCSPVQS